MNVEFTQSLCTQPLLLVMHCVCASLSVLDKRNAPHIFTVKGINLFYIFQDPCNDQKYFCTILFPPKEFKMRNHERKSEIIWICYTAFKK